MTINLVSAETSPHHSQVEWPQLCEIIAQFAYFGPNKLRVRSEVFLGRTEELQAELAMIGSYRQRFRDDYRQVFLQLLSRMPSDGSLADLINRVAKEGVLGFTELNRLAHLIEAGQFLKDDFPDLGLPQVARIQEPDYHPVQRKLLREFRHLVDGDGSLHLDRHPELADVSRRLRELEERIRRSVQDWLNRPEHQRLLQYQSYDVHHDRFVVPVRSDSYRAELGFIVSRSETGQTLFVEPFEVREQCNRRMELIAKIDEIINQLALKFSRSFAQHLELLRMLQHEFSEADFYLAKASFAQRHGLECPKLRDVPGFRFEQLFHPLLDRPVKNSVECRSSDHGIVISGPNTGGKTVFLKSVTLSYLLFYHGHFVPALEAELFPYEGLFYFGNDLQDLKVGLSSFSGEVKNYIELIEQILPSNLILIDEIFNSTSSDEASALSLAYFEELHRRATCHLVVSTHHQMFKTLSHQDRHYQACHVGFDSEGMRPTYRIQWGTPGASMAIDIFAILARGHDLVREIPARARALLSSKNISYETLLQKVSQKQIELDRLLSSNRQLEVELKNQKGAMEGVLALRLQKELARARREIEKLTREARNLVEEARRGDIQKVRKIDEREHQLTGQLRQLAGEAGEKLSSAPVGNLTLDEVSAGDIVHSLVLKKDFTVTGVDRRRQEVQISKGPIKLSVPVHTLAGSGKKKAATPSVSVHYQKSTQARFEYDVRGMRLSECQNLIEGALGGLLAGDVPFVSVIHGHGDGVLKNWLRDYVRRSKDFKWEIPENGNDGETKITLQ
jgi:DNA mismatch repair protein MutS2